jgi:hypothetical protein
MDLDAMAIHVRKLKEFRDKWEPFLEELAKQKAFMDPPAGLHRHERDNQPDDFPGQVGS